LLRQGILSRSRQCGRSSSRKKSGVTDKKECEERTAMPSDVPGEVEVDYKAAESASDESDTKVTKHTKQVTAP